MIQDTSVERLEGVFRATNKIPEDKTVTFVFDGDDLTAEMNMEEIEIGDLEMLEVRIR